ncbi:MAG: thiolase domain-containing protein [Candidatus Aenigmarchaeota archaeon]|nr:thiolase domain-containing protein [Candidatus Aenigmarchaeota archaeon]
MRNVAVVGYGLSKFGERWEAGLKELVSEAAVAAINASGVEPKQIQCLFTGAMSSGRFANQEHLGALVADQLGLTPIPSVRVEAACASGGVAVRQAYLALASGAYDLALVVGVEKMTDIDVGHATTTLGTAGDYEWEVFHGATFPALYAMMARRHMHDFGTKEEQMAMVSVKNHSNGSKNKFAQFQNLITVDAVLNSSVVASPLKLLDCSPITDGAAAIVMASENLARKFTDAPVWIAGSAQASDTLALHDRESLTSLKATKVAAEYAYKQANVRPNDIKVAEVHDCFSIAEILAIEDLGFFNKGYGGKAVEEGETQLNSKISVNSSGGLKACGHPVGATGVKQIVELTMQLRNEAGARQVSNADIGLAHNVGGSGATAVVHVLRR